MALSRARHVIVEEAAEVLEAHVLVSLVGEVEHFVMIEMTSDVFNRALNISPAVMLLPRGGFTEETTEMRR